MPLQINVRMFTTQKGTKQESLVEVGYQERKDLLSMKFMVGRLLFSVV